MFFGRFLSAINSAKINRFLGKRSFMLKVFGNNYRLQPLIRVLSENRISCADFYPQKTALRDRLDAQMTVN